jgi:hypothetical protein
MLLLALVLGEALALLHHPRPPAIDPSAVALFWRLCS